MFLLWQHEAHKFPLLSSPAAAPGGEWCISSGRQEAKFCPDDGGRPRDWRPRLLRKQNSEVHWEKLTHPNKLSLYSLFCWISLLRAVHLSIWVLNSSCNCWWIVIAGPPILTSWQTKGWSWLITSLLLPSAPPAGPHFSPEDTRYDQASEQKNAVWLTLCLMSVCRRKLPLLNTVILNRSFQRSFIQSLNKFTTWEWLQRDTLLQFLFFTLVYFFFFSCRNLWDW